MEHRSEVLKLHDAWVARLYTAFQEGRIHCPGCLSYERLTYEWSIKILEKKSDRTSQEEEELKFDRLKIGFLDFIYKKVCNKAVEKKTAVIQSRLAREKQVLSLNIAASVAASSNEVEEDLYC
jgi:hypothetical protein